MPRYTTISALSIAGAGLFMLPSHVIGQDGPTPDRKEVAESLRAAEDLRARYQIKSSTTYHYEVKGQSDRRILFTRLADGTGRLRREKWNEGPDHQPENSVELTCWDGVQSRGDLHHIGSHASDPHVVQFAPKPAGSDFIDEVENVLGLGIRSPVTDRTPPLRPSEAIGNPDIPVIIEEVNSGGSDLIRVHIDGPWGPKSNMYIYDFDPQRQWLVKRIEIRVYQSHEQHVNDQSRYIMGYETTQSEQVDGVWMPQVVEMRTREADTVEPGARWSEFSATMRLESIDMEPEISDEDFTFSIADFPKGTAVMDVGLGISYELGENLLYADGILHEVASPIDHELNAREMQTLLASSKPLIDPELSKIDLKPVGGDSLKWIGRIGGMFGIAVLFTVGLIVYRRRTG